ncbi:hypothetical protein ACFPRL_12700 [Pseudoclavibacter helvolus]
MPEDASCAGRSSAEALEDLDRGALAGAVRSEQGEGLAVAHVEGEPVDDVAVSVALDEVGDLNGGWCVHASIQRLTVRAGEGPTG